MWRTYGLERFRPTARQHQRISSPALCQLDLTFTLQGTLSLSYLNLHQTTLTLNRLTSGPYFSFFSYFSLFFDPDPYFSLLFKKTALLSLLFGVSCCQIKWRTLKTCLFTLIFNIKSTFLLIKSLSPIQTMYILAHFYISLKKFKPW